MTCFRLETVAGIAPAFAGDAGTGAFLLGYTV